ncbi:MAG TPA: hypothetical protein VHF47_06790 [Acidimicrobiales bacterium]|nr:hypothetical protein [Acidimicrobiales bacterium]
MRLFLAALLLSYAPATELCRFADPRIDESSGVSASSRTDDWFFTHNDSGDSARFFAVDRTGATLAVFEVDDADADDWEDMARGRNEGRPVLFLGDIGDNFRRRQSVVVYEVLEPRPKEGNAALKVLRRHELRYEDGPHDAETLLVHPRDGRIWVVTKERDGVAGVYFAEAGTLRRQGDVRLDALVRRPGTYARAVTSGEIRADGRKVVLRTPFEAFEWTIDNDVAAAFAGPPLRIPLPSTEQGEAIAYTRYGGSLLLTTEGRGAPVHLVEGTELADPNHLQPAEPLELPPDEPGPPVWPRVVALVVSVVGGLYVRARRGRRQRRHRPPPRRPRSA